MLKEELTFHELTLNTSLTSPATHATHVRQITFHRNVAFLRFLTVQAVGGVGAATWLLLLLLFAVAPLFEALTRHFARDEAVEEGWVVAQEVGDRFRCETCAQDITYVTIILNTWQ